MRCSGLNEAACGRASGKVSTSMQVMGIVGWKNSGKTTLVVRLVEHLTACGLEVSTVKHAHHNVQIDKPGKDSFRHREAGAREVVLATSERWALIHELKSAPEPDLSQLLAKMAPVDLVIVEGFKRFDFAKIEVRRADTDGPLLAAEDPDIVAFAADGPVRGAQLPVLDLNNTAAIADFILARARLARTG
jgi:molybdopterin-guanine dinucleotide biosynthesis protein MobB